MLNVIVDKNDKGTFGLWLFGHCGAGEKGNDLACAGASTLFSQAVIMIDDNIYKLKRSPEIKINDGNSHLIFTAKRKYRKELEACFDMIIGGYQWLQNEYPQNVNIVF